MENRFVNAEPEKCCGCGACAETCPVKAISMEENEYGFIMPRIAHDLCLNCGKCNLVCPFVSPERFLSKELPLKTYAAASKNEKLLKYSASGGVFSGVAHYYLSNGDIVFGATMRKDFSVKHIGIDSKTELQSIQGSKYTQSDMSDAFSSVKQQLELERRVLFSGTPCQIAALKSFLAKEYDNLLTMDLVCHGVGSNKMFKEDIAFLSNRKKSEIESVSFRSKRKGWGVGGDLFLKNKIKDYSPADSPYYYYYLDSSIFRDSCYHCPFATERRIGDITIGDFWRVETLFRDCGFDIDKGVSCLIINTKKGKELIDRIGEAFILKETDYQEIVKRNGNLRTATPIPKKRPQLFHIYSIEGYDGLARHYYQSAIIARVRYKVKSMIPGPVKRAIKKMIR